MKVTWYSIVDSTVVPGTYPEFIFIHLQKSVALLLFNLFVRIDSYCYVIYAIMTCIISTWFSKVTTDYSTSVPQVPP